MGDVTHLFRRLLGALERVAMILSGTALLIMGGIVTASVLGRQLFNAPIPDDLIMVGLLMVCVIALPLAFIESQSGHIAVTVTTDWLPVRARGLLRAFGALAMMVFFGSIGFMVSQKLPREIAQGTYYDGTLEIPTWPMKIVFAAGIALFVLRLAVSIAEGLRTCATGVAPAHDRPTAPDRSEQV
ncbi:TRAP transporter small permease [Algihabitans albus]|uniref:TRAP transporter small permease n=1 Tax=Algihabitans albus TaxID=2164067 RepID=UPI000E5C832C|nr:TRAP transporter small permease [Algihabitans albus]